jgi:hypothetical protein
MEVVERQSTLTKAICYLVFEESLDLLMEVVESQSTLTKAIFYLVFEESLGLLYYEWLFGL